MIRKEDQYFTVNRILLLTIGLWPYQQSNFTTFQYIFISVILTAIIVFQLTTFLTLNCTSELLMNVLSSVSFFIIFMIKYNMFRFHIENVKDLLMQFQHVRNKLKDKNEIAIIKKYDYTAKRYTVSLITLAACTISLSIIFQFWTNMADVDSPTNVSRSYYFLFKMEYFIDQEKYFYLILLHINVAVCFGMVIMLGIGTMFIACIQHTCGMFRIASYRIEHAINIKTGQNITLENEILMTEGTICAVDIHRLNKHLMSVLEIMFFCLIVCCVACLSLNLFQITSFENDAKNFLMPFVCALACTIYMFLSNLMGQIVIDHNNHVFTTAYNVQWYKTPLHIQRMILFMLQIGIKEFCLNIGGVFDASIEGFATLVKASISYFTVIHSTR
ncbi:uncharacterized protein [Temnothorax longispinosus]|uniref:uncharacterized protein isoform X2 n=1 Tax=Temnothorax longispinosus TaxID=300112 RepID=UPI003A993EE1